SRLAQIARHAEGGLLSAVITGQVVALVIAAFAIERARAGVAGPHFEFDATDAGGDRGLWEPVQQIRRNVAAARAGLHSKQHQVRRFESIRHDPETEHVAVAIPWRRRAVP